MLKKKRLYNIVLVRFVFYSRLILELKDMSNDILHQLMLCPLFKNMTVQEVNQLLMGSGCKIDTYKKNDIVALIGYPCNYLLIVLKGSLVARMVSDSGKFVDIEKLGIGNVLAPAMLFAEDNVFPVNVLPEENVTLFRLKKEKFLEWMQSNKTLLFNFIQLISDVNRFLSKKINFLALKTLRGKIAEYLLHLSAENDEQTEVTIPFTRQELADKFGVSRQSLIRSLSELETEGCIKIENRRIILIDKDSLSAEI